jgi:hypothetical protein
MSQQVPAWFAPWYSDQVIHKVQHKGFRLRGTTQGGDVKANEANWRIAAKVAAQKLIRGSDATPVNGGRSKVTATMDQWQVFDYVYEEDLERLGVNEKDVVTTSGAMALGRAFDEEIMREANAAAAGASVTDTTNGLTFVNALAFVSAAQVAAEAMWDGDWYCPLPAKLWNQLNAYKQFNSSDHVGEDMPFTKMTDTRKWNGINWFLAPDVWFPVPSANQVDILLWHRSALGYTTNWDVRTTLAWENIKTAWSVNMRMSGIAKALLPEIIIRGRFNTNATITPN